MVRILRFRAQTAGTRPAHAVSRQASGPVNFLAHVCGSDGNGAKTHNLGNDTRDGKRRGEDSREIDWQKSVRSFLCPLGLVRRWVLPHRESRRHQKHTMCKILVKLKRLFLKRWSEHRSIEGFTSHETHIHGKEAHTWERDHTDAPEHHLLDGRSNKQGKRYLAALCPLLPQFRKVWTTYRIIPTDQHLALQRFRTSKMQ